MKTSKHFFSLLSLGMTVSSLPIQQEYGKREIRVMTFNIRYGSAADGLNSWPFRRSFLAKVIKKSLPDILGLQEAEESQVAYILKSLDCLPYISIGTGRGKDEKGESTRILVNSLRFSVESSGTFWLSDTPDVPGSTSYGNHLPRIATWAHLKEHGENGTGLTIVNTHLDHESQSARIKGVQQILDWISLHAVRNPVIVTGDFNNEADDSEEIQLMEKFGFSDIHFELHGERPATFHEFTGDAESLSLPKIDFIWQKGDLEAVSSSIIKSRSFFGQYPSDHFPILSSINH